MTEIVFIRHGETDANHKGLFAGKSDHELNQNGIRQAHEAAEKLKGQAFDAIFCGNTKRVRQTFEIIRQTIVFPPDKLFFTDDIREINFGDWENLSADEISRKYAPKWQEYMDNWTNFTFPNGENNCGYFEHCGRFIKQAAEKFHGKKIAVFGHKGFSLACACALKEMPVECMFDIEIQNGSFFWVNVG